MSDETELTLGNETIVMEHHTNRKLLTIKGLLPLPAGSRIRITDRDKQISDHGHFDAIVYTTGTVATGPGGRIDIQLDVVIEDPDAT